MSCKRAKHRIWITRSWLSEQSDYIRTENDWRIRWTIQPCWGDIFPIFPHFSPFSHPSIAVWGVGTRPECCATSSPGATDGRHSAPLHWSRHSRSVRRARCVEPGWGERNQKWVEGHTERTHNMYINIIYIHKYVYTHTHLYIYMYNYMYTSYVYVKVWYKELGYNRTGS